MSEIFHLTNRVIKLENELNALKAEIKLRPDIDKFQDLEAKLNTKIEALKMELRATPKTVEKPISIWEFFRK